MVESRRSLVIADASHGALLAEPLAFVDQRGARSREA